VKHPFPAAMKNKKRVRLLPILLWLRPGFSFFSYGNSAITVRLLRRTSM
jgi:hypothetical protein